MPERVFVVREEDGGSVDAIVARAGEDASALDEGRVFVGPARWRRAKRGDAVRPGDAVRIVTGGAARAPVSVLHRGAGVVAVDKPAGVATIPDTHDAEGSLVVQTARALGLPPTALHPTSRLDRGVSGVVVFTTTDRAREELRAARATGAYHRLYAALAARAPEPREGEWTMPVGRARDPRKRAVGGRDATSACTRYRTVAATARGALLAVEPVTGRTHQIRLHASHAGAPLLGDRDYGGARSLVLESGKVLGLERVALHCLRVRVRMPRASLDVRAPVPETLRAWWSAVGGRDVWAELDDGDR